MGCNQVFGLDETSRMPAARFSVNKLWLGTTAALEPLDLSSATATYLLPDETEPSGFRSYTPTLLPPSTWQHQFPPEVVPQIRYSLTEDSVVRVITVPQREIAQLYMDLGKPAAEPAPPLATMKLSVDLTTPYNANEALLWYSLGAWSSYAFSAARGELPGVGTATWNPPAVPFKNATSFLEQRPLDRLRQTDAFVVLRYSVAGALSGQFIAAPFDQVDGENLIMGKLQPVTADQPLRANLNTDDGAVRLARVKPAMVNRTMQWSVVAAPGAAFGNGSGPLLHSKVLPPATTGIFAVREQYGNPFSARGWGSLLVWQHLATRDYGPAGVAKVSLAATLLWAGPPPAQDHNIETSACLPTLTKLQGMELDVDGKVVALDRNRPVAVSFSADIADLTAADLYSIELREVTFAPTASSMVRRVVASHTQPSWSLPGDLFEAGKTYMIRSICYRGLPGVAQGDLEARGLPFIVGYSDSGVFSVVAP